MQGPQLRIAAWRTVAASVARTLFNVAAVGALYYLLPLTAEFGWRSLVELLGGLVLLALLLGGLIRTILRAPYPALRAMEGLGFAIPLFLLMFAAAYVILSASQPEAFTQVLSRTDALYFVMTVFTTVGFGDITPVSETARMLVTVQMVLDLLLLGLVLQAVVNAARRGAAEQQAERSRRRTEVMPRNEDES